MQYTAVTVKIYKYSLVYHNYITYISASRTLFHFHFFTSTNINFKKNKKLNRLIYWTNNDTIYVYRYNHLCVFNNTYQWKKNKNGNTFSKSHNTLLHIKISSFQHNLFSDILSNITICLLIYYYFFNFVIGKLQCLCFPNWFYFKKHPPQVLQYLLFRSYGVRGESKLTVFFENEVVDEWADELEAEDLEAEDLESEDLVTEDLEEDKEDLEK